MNYFKKTLFIIIISTILIIISTFLNSCGSNKEITNNKTTTTEATKITTRHDTLRNNNRQMVITPGLRRDIVISEPCINNELKVFDYYIVQSNFKGHVYNDHGKIKVNINIDSIISVYDTHYEKIYLEKLEKKSLIYKNETNIYKKKIKTLGFKLGFLLAFLITLFILLIILWLKTKYKTLNPLKILKL